MRKRERYRYTEYPHICFQYFQFEPELNRIESVSRNSKKERILSGEKETFGIGFLLD
jgi:hypothetical protein